VHDPEFELYWLQFGMKIKHVDPTKVYPEMQFRQFPLELAFEQKLGSKAQLFWVLM